ncbi:uncharacterized protein DS421_15g512420 [Arachis hypogaea]|nr:uncharacterized protein DS421_15g512420 [Arachis hypogaea]
MIGVKNAQEVGATGSGDERRVGHGATRPATAVETCDQGLLVCPPMEADSPPGLRLTPAMASPRSLMDGEPDPDAELRCLAPRESEAGSKVDLLRLTDDTPRNCLNLIAEGVDRDRVRAELAVDDSDDNMGNSDGKDKEREEMMMENRRTWELAVELELCSMTKKMISWQSFKNRTRP